MHRKLGFRSARSDRRTFRPIEPERNGVQCDIHVSDGLALPLVWICRLDR